jgi:4a-hydroxytetrahydrobiopterin dehydratase
MIENWAMRKHPARLERRIEFDDYQLTREFLEITADLSKQEGYYPDMNFGSRHVSMTIYLEGEPERPDVPQRRFAEAVNRLAPSERVSAPLESEYTVERC